MKNKHLLLVIAAMLCSAFVSYAQSYHICAYRWGILSRDNWSRTVKADIKITLDLENRTLTIDGPKKVANTYDITDEHASNFEKYAPAFEGPKYCISDSRDARGKVYFRTETKTGQVRWIYIAKNDGYTWQYFVAEE